MAKYETPQSSPKANSEANRIWENFLTASTVCGGVAAAILILMAIFLV